MASNSGETNTTTTTMRLKLMVDVKANKVVFAEAGKDFVDFIFHLMTLPLAAISKLLKTEPMMQVESSNLGGLYQSINSIDADCFQPDLDKESLLSPKTSIAVPFFSFFDFPTTWMRLYKYNERYEFYRVTDYAGTICPTHIDETLGVNLSDYKYVVPTASKMLTHKTSNYVKSDTKYLVTDKMEVKPLTISFVVSLLKNLDLNLNYLEELQVQLSPQQGLAIVKAVLENRDVLTSVFLQEKVKEEVN